MCFFFQTRLTRRYRIKAGVPTLILLEGSNGSIVTRGGVERTIADPTGLEFPWRPPHPKAALEDGPLLPCGARDSNEPMLHEELRYCYKGVYFSAHWVWSKTKIMEMLKLLTITSQSISLISMIILVLKQMCFKKNIINLY